MRIGLDAPLPSAVRVGAGTALFVCGTCFCPQAPLRSLELLVDGAPQPVIAHSMPRLDFFRSLHPEIDPYAVGGAETDPASSEDPLLLSYRSGFWALAAIPARSADGDCELALRALLEGGETVEAPLARLPALAGPESPVEGIPTPTVAICMATYEPPSELFRRQVESIQAQTFQDWVCYVSDDCSTARSFEMLTRTLADDKRFVVSRSPRRLGFYANFERALSMAPAGARFVTLADQDDRWHPDKLQALLDSIGDAKLIYSDARVVARDGRVISNTYWSRRHNNHSDLTSLLIANSVTGAASLFPRELLDYALPFPPAQFAHYHDHWLGLTALALGRVRFLDRPLYDYVQHGDAWLGHATANRMRTLRDRLGGLRTRSPRDRIRKWRMHYFVDIARLMQFATVLELRCGPLMAPSKRRLLRRFARGDDSLPTLVRLLGRGTRELVGRPETLGAEWMLLFALLWRHALGLTARRLPQRRLRLDAVPPPDLSPAPERIAGAAATASTPLAISAKIAPLRLDIREDAPQRINLLIPTIDLDHFFGGYIAKLNLARRLSERGHRVRVVTVDPVGRLPRSWQRRLESYSGLQGLSDRVEFEFGRELAALEVGPRDGFIATTWWTAHIAAAAARTLGAGPFVYLIQEYEPFTFPMGSYAALATQSYSFEHFALFSSELLRDYFRRHSIGVYARDAAAGDAASASFQNAITAFDPPDAVELGARATPRLLFYARPEPHATRNLFELGVLALSRAIADGCFSGWELRGIGSVQSDARLALGAGRSLELLPRSGQEEYARLLREHDVGLALMFTPHPSLVPIEMAAAGMLTVTNTFENKTREELSAISSNLVAAQPTVESIAAALGQAAAGVGDIDRRLRGADVRWSRDWSDSFGDDLVDRVASVLAQPVAGRAGA